jgi:hypothetical protein
MSASGRLAWPFAVASVAVLAGCGSGKPTAGSADTYASFLKFSVCMRSHGVPDFPDPSPGGGIRLGLSPGFDLDPRSPGFQSARRSCKHFLPGGGPSATVPESVKLSMLRHAECMRTHGVPNFPDPIFPRGGGIGTLVPPDNSSAFRSAAKACGGFG